MTEPTVPETAIAQIERAAVGAKQRRESVSTTDYLVAPLPDIAPPIYRAMIICSMALQYLQAIAPSSVDFSLDEALARIRALSEALQEACHERDGLLAKVPEWQPIETAPRDGAWVLLAREFEWSTPGWWAEDNSEGDWYELNNHPSDSWGGPLAGVSHWMPLPTPPGEK